jgi:hypothetical protein
MSIQAGAIVYFGLLPQTAALGWVIGGVMLQGLSAGLALAALQRAAMSQVHEKRLATGAGLFRMTEVGGMILGTTLAGVFLQLSLGGKYSTVDAYQIVFWSIAPVSLLAAAVGHTIRECQE